MGANGINKQRERERDLLTHDPGGGSRNLRARRLSDKFLLVKMEFFRNRL